MKKIFVFFIGVGFLGLMFSSPARSESGDVLLTGLVPGCGNNVLEDGEVCDGTDFASKTCANIGLGFSGGTLGCAADCTLITSACTVPVIPPVVSGGGGGGGGGALTLGTTNSTIFSGKAFPSAKVVLVQDSQIAATVYADNLSNFSFTLSKLTAGNYTFGLYAEDGAKNRSAISNISTSITSASNKNFPEIFLAPILTLDKSSVKKGDNIYLSGRTVPDANISAWLDSNGALVCAAKASANGSYSCSYNTLALSNGSHYFQIQALSAQKHSASSTKAFFSVGTESISGGLFNVADFNRDSRVNIYDFSMLMYWYRSSNPDSMVDANKDGKADLIDFSIMMSNWTG